MGGKSSKSISQTGAWIAGLLPPPEKRQTYLEPFCGMLGVLLQRSPPGHEIVNDADGAVINWWRTVRTQPQ